MKRAVVGLLGALATTTAFAADLPTKAPFAPVVTAYNWTGFYLGGHAGWGWIDNTTTIIDGSPQFPAGTVLNSQNDGGFIGGGQVGYNFQFGSWVLGVEGDFTGTSINACSSTLGNGGFTTTPCLGTNWTADVTGRLGYAWDNWLLYAKGGFAWGDFSSTAQTFNAAGTMVTTSSGGETRTGWVLGGGLEYALGGNWSAKVEYTYMDFANDTVTRTQNNLVTGAVSQVQRTNDTQVQEVKFGINYRFNWGAPIVAKY